MRLKKRLFTFVLVIALVLPGVLYSLPLPVLARTTSDLYGTGSADEINIVKLLDMALNKGGMSMSPATIKAFLDFWWTSVRADLDQCISNIGTAYSTSNEFAEALISGLVNVDHYDKLGGIITKYLRYCMSLGDKTVSDFVQLITQAGTFRKFLLSYVTDEDGNIAGTVDNKLKKYNLKGGLVNMVRQAADAYVEEYEGYYLIRTFTYNDFPATEFDSKSKYDFVCNTFKTATSDGVYLLQNFSGLKIFQATGYAFVGTLSSSPRGFKFNSYTADWDIVSLYSASITDFSAPIDLSGYNPASVSNRVSIGSYQNYIQYEFDSNGHMSAYLYPVTADGRSIKIWKTLDGFKNYSVGKQNIYYSSNYSTYDSSIDNSVEFTGSYYNNTSTTYSHETIQNNIDNSQETINESTVNNIVNNYITNVTNNYGSGSGSGDGSGGWNLGEGIEAFIKGVAELLDFVLKLLGDLIGLLATFATSVLDVLKSLAVVGSSFGDFLKEVFGFLPEECISLIISSIGAMCLVGIIKTFKK